MSAAAAKADTPTNASDAAPKKGKKKLVIVLIVLALLASAGGGGAYYYTKKKAAEAELAAEDGEDTDEAAAPKKSKKQEKGAPPVFMPLEVFTVNLADKDAERFLQLGVTLEVDESKTSDQLKAYMPAIRNNILMLIAHKSAADLQSQEGKQTLARQIQQATLKPIGIDLADEEADDDADTLDDDNSDKKGNKKKKKKKAKKAQPRPPVVAVHFSSFIIQ